jgi:hypothetical protein
VSAVAAAGVVSLHVAGPEAPWTGVGLRVENGWSWIGGTALRFDASDAPAALTGWTLLGDGGASSIDGLATQWVPDADLASWEHPLGARSFDHVVVMTSSLERTCGAIERETGAPLKRVREAGAVRQGFHRIGAMVVEVVESAQVRAGTASFWGFVLVVDDLDAAASGLGEDVVSPPKDAVQPGRRIATFRRAAGLVLPTALMSA